VAGKSPLGYLINYAGDFSKLAESVIAGVFRSFSWLLQKKKSFCKRPRGYNRFRNVDERLFLIKYEIIIIEIIISCLIKKCSVFRDAFYEKPGYLNWDNWGRHA